MPYSNNYFARNMCQSMSSWHLTSYIFLLYIHVFQYFTVSLFVWLFVEKVDLCLRILNNTEPVTQKTCCQNLTSKQCLLKWLGLARWREEILYPVSFNLPRGGVNKKLFLFTFGQKRGRGASRPIQKILIRKYSDFFWPFLTKSWVFLPFFH